MTYYDEKLQTLQAQCSRKKQLSAQVEELRRQRTTLESHVQELNKIFQKEQSDVDKLEGRSLAALFYHMTGRMDEQLTKECREAYAAKAKYDAAQRELLGIEDDLDRRTDELSRLMDCEAQYQAVLQEKAAALKAAGGAAAQEILRLETKRGALQSQQRELSEALSAGRTALSTVDGVLDSLSSAESWGTWDVWGGGVISDLAKHNHLDSAQNKIELLQSQLRRFKTELADVEIRADLQVSLDGFMRFADFFFDNIFLDWSILDRIKDSKRQVLSTQNEIEGVMSTLDTMSQENDRELQEVNQQLDALVLKAQL